MKSTRVRRELIIIRTAKELPSRRNVANYEIEHSAWIESSEIQWTTKVPTAGETLVTRSTRLIEPNFFPCICSLQRYLFTFDT